MPNKPEPLRVVEQMEADLIGSPDAIYNRGRGDHYRNYPQAQPRAVGAHHDAPAEEPGAVSTTHSSRRQRSVQAQPIPDAPAQMQFEVPPNSKPASTLSVPVNPEKQESQFEDFEDYELSREVADDLLCYALRQHFMHRLASSFFHSRFICWSLWPSAGLTLLCSIAALLSSRFQSSSVPALLTGIAAALSTFLQAFGSTLKYNSRADMHDIAAIRFEDLAGQLERIMIYEENLTPSAKGNNADYQEHKLDVSKIEQRIQEVTSSCTSAIPSIISSLFSGLDAHFDGEMRELKRKDPKRDIHAKLEYNEAKRMMLRALFAKIRTSEWWSYQPWWPFACKGLVTEVLHEVKNNLKDDPKNPSLRHIILSIPNFVKT